MPKNQNYWDNAGFVRDQGWKVGDHLRGGNIEHSGKVTETGMEIVLTAVGDHAVLARRLLRLDADGNKVASIADREHLFSFGSREWELVPQSPGACLSEDEK
jgi:hypothetical protein